VTQTTELGGYQLVGRLAVGGMAEIYQAKALAETQKSPGEPDEVVLKRLLPAHRSDEAFIGQFVEEAKLTTRLRHPNIVRTFRCFKSGLDYLIVQDLVQGRTLEYMSDAFRQAGAKLPLSAATYIVICVLRALDYVHRARIGEGGGGITHGDVSPSNILLSVQGEVKLTDFGLAAVEGVPRVDTGGSLRGTIPYMSPEAVLGRPADHRSDLFSVGVVLWELYAGQALFTGANDLEVMHKVRDARVPSALTLNAELPEMGGLIVRKALQPDRTHRFQSAQDFCRALEVLARRNGWPVTVDALKPLLEA
jgi:serine/threonine-protein kinase